jgi:hypothetical protein
MKKSIFISLLTVSFSVSLVSGQQIPVGSSAPSEDESAKKADDFL